MDKETYYLLAVMFSCLSALFSSISFFFLIRDRRVDARCHACFVAHRGGARTILPASIVGDDDRSALGQGGILISNVSGVPCTVESVVLMRVTRRWLWPLFSFVEDREVPGEFLPSEFPQTIKGREASVFVFNPSEVRSNRLGLIRIRIAGAKDVNIDIAEQFFDKSRVQRNVERVKMLRESR
jgi:hypothetical protein